MTSKQGQSKGEQFCKDEVFGRGAQSGFQSGALADTLNKVMTKMSDIENRLRTVEDQLNVVKTSFAEEKRVSTSDVTHLSIIMDKRGNDTWDYEEAVKVLPGAARFGMKNMVTKLSSVLINAYTLVTCIQLFQLASQCELGELWDTSKEWISENFIQVSQAAKDFWKLTLDEMCVLVYSDTLCANEEDIFQAITLWVQKDRTSRISSSTVLLRAVQFRHCTLKFLERILDHYLIFGNLDLECAVKEAIKQWTDGKNYCSPTTKRSERHSVLFVLGGYDNDSITETYNTAKPSWTEQEMISNGPSKATFAFTAGHQILVLGVDHKRFSSFETLTKVWNELRPLPTVRHRMSAAMEKNELLVMGGLGHESRCEVYDINMDSWSHVTSLNVGRWWSASTSLQGKIYCCGGETGDGQWLSCMEVFDPKEKSKGWTMKASMSVGRSGHCLVSCGNYLWAVGGSDGVNYLTDFERYESSTNSWTKMASMPTGRSTLTTSFFGGRLYAIGGYKDESLNTVEVYDPAKNRWSTGASLSRGRYCHASCVVKEMSNADEYQWFV